MGAVVFSIANFAIFTLLGEWLFNPSILSSAMLIVLVYAAATLWMRLSTFAHTKAMEDRGARSP